MDQSRKMSERLNDLLQRNMDAEKGFRSASNDVQNERLKEFLTRKASESYDFRHELRSEIRNFGEEIKDEGSMEGNFRRTWSDFRTALSSNKEEVALEETIKMERDVIDDYNKAISEFDFPPSTANLLIRQRNAIKCTVKEAKELDKVFH